MAEELLSVLTRFHHEVVVPDIERIVDAKITPLREEMLANFDAVFKRLDRLESEYYALAAAVKRLEERMMRLEERMMRLEERAMRLEDRMTAVEQKIDKIALRSELMELKEHVQALEQRIADLEGQL